MKIHVAPLVNNRWKSALLSQGLLLVVLCAPRLLAGADDEPQKRKADGAAAADQNVRREFLFHVKSTAGEPVAGAKVVPWAVACDNGSFAVDEELFPGLVSGADGTVRVVFPDDAALEKPATELKTRLLRVGLRRGLQRIALRVDHPDFPQWSNYLPTEGGQVDLVEPATIIIRARHGNAGGLLRDLYPMLGHAFWSGTDWSRTDGVLTIRRVDLKSEHASRWLRVLHVPKDGAVLFSDVIQLKQDAASPVELDLALKPGVRFVGRLSGDVPRPIRNGRILAHIVTGQDGWTNWYWSATTEVSEDGKFVLDALPPDEHLQVIAQCEGWVSASPTQEEFDAYCAESGFNSPNFHPIAGHVRPRLFQITDRPVIRSIPMEGTSRCKVTVLGAEDKPVEGAKVSFWPNQFWFNGGANVLGTGIDMLSVIRDETAGGRRKRPVWNSESSFSATTDRSGTALIAGLPCGGAGDRKTPVEYTFNVVHDDYATADPLTRDLPKVSVIPGETGQTTVRLKRN